MCPEILIKSDGSPLTKNDMVVTRVLVIML